MRTYYVLKQNKKDGVAFIKKGFSWPALIFGFFWAAIYEMWLVALIFFLSSYGLKFAEYYILANGAQISPIIPVVTSLVSIAAIIVLPFIGNKLRVHQLKNDGYELIDEIKASSINKANDKYSNVKGVRPLYKKPPPH